MLLFTGSGRDSIQYLERDGDAFRKLVVTGANHTVSIDDLSICVRHLIERISMQLSSGLTALGYNIIETLGLPLQLPDTPSGINIEQARIVEQPNGMKADTPFLGYSIKTKDYEVELACAVFCHFPFHFESAYCWQEPPGSHIETTNTEIPTSWRCKLHLSNLTFFGCPYRLYLVTRSRNQFSYVLLST